ECAAIENTGDVLEPFTDLHAGNGGIDRGEGAHHLLNRQTDLKWFVVLRIEGFGRRHAACHPQQDDAVGGRPGCDRFVREQTAWLTSGERGDTCSREGLQKVATRRGDFRRVIQHV